MVHLLTRIGAAVVSGVTARVLGARLPAGILERVLLTGDVGVVVPVPAVDLLLVLLGAAEAVGLLAECAGLPAVPVAAVDLLLVLLGAAEAAGLLAERAGLPAVPVAAVDLLLVLLGAAEAAGLLAECAGLPYQWPPSTCCSFCCVPDRPAR